MQTLLTVLLLLAAAGAGRPAPGDAAPGFTLPGPDGKPVSLVEFAGKKTVVLAFFPKAFTSG